MTVIDFNTRHPKTKTRVDDFWPQSSMTEVQYRLLNLVPKGKSAEFDYAIKADVFGDIASVATGFSSSLMYNAPKAPIDRVFQSWLVNNSEIFDFHHNHGHKSLTVGRFTSLDNGDSCLVVYYIVNDKGETILDSALIEEYLKLDGSERWIKAAPIRSLGTIHVSEDQIVTTRGITEQRGGVVGLPYQEKLNDGRGAEIHVGNTIQQRVLGFCRANIVPLRGS